MHHRGQTTCPPGHLHHTMSQEGRKDPQGQQPLPVHPAIIQKTRSVQVHQSWDRETEKQLLSQGHTATNTERLLPSYRLEIIGHFNKWISSHFNNATLIMFTYLALLISYCLCRSAIGIPFLYLDLYVLGSCCGIVRLHVRYCCTVRTRSTSISLHSQ